MPSRPLNTAPPSQPVQIPFPTATRPRHHTRISPLATIFAALAALVLVASLVMLLIFHWRRKRKQVMSSRTAPSSLPSSASPPDPAKQALEVVDLKPQRFTFDQLRRATSWFAQSNKLGQGGFGSVFSGVLPSGKEIAVKFMDSGSFQGEIEFQNELSLASSVMKIDGEDGFSNKHVVFPIGFCSEEETEEERKKKRRRRKKKKGRRRRRSWFDDVEDEEDGDGDGDEEEDVDGEEGVKRKVLMLVYELMQNGSLQDALLVRKKPEMMDWGRRFAVVLDVARGLEFLHTICDPPIVHGDIKPSNILLDVCFSAKIADFGLARPLTPASPSATVKVEGNVNGGEKSPDPTTGNGGVARGIVVIDVDGEDNISTGGVETESALAVGGGLAAIGSVEDEGFPRVVCTEGDEMVSSPVNLEVASTSETGGFDKLSVDSGMEYAGSRNGYLMKNATISKASGNDWWWRQDVESKSESGTGVKDYVMEWIGSEIGKERPNGNWVDPSEPTSSMDEPKSVSLEVKKRQQRRVDWWNSMDVDRSKKKKEKSRPAREWWREEFCEELAKKKQKKLQLLMPKSSSCSLGGGGSKEKLWWQKGENSGTALERRSRKMLSWSRGSRGSTDWRKDGLSEDLRMPGRRRSHDWASGDIPKSGGVSSTPSMRGTMCYAAPECGGEVLSEKCDIYSFGVLLLVLISGRRPLQVAASPMSEFERANLISWARHLARKGKLLDLVDSSLPSVDQEQALLCITLALICLQRSPSRRPSIKEVVGMLSGDLEPPHLPQELSPSPPYVSFKSRKKAR